MLVALFSLRADFTAVIKSARLQTSLIDQDSFYNGDWWFIDVIIGWRLRWLWGWCWWFATPNDHIYRSSSEEKLWWQMLKNSIPSYFLTCRPLQAPSPVSVFVCVFVCLFVCLFVFLVVCLLIPLPVPNWASAEAQFIPNFSLSIQIFLWSIQIFLWASKFFFEHPNFSLSGY